MVPKTEMKKGASANNTSVRREEYTGEEEQSQINERIEFSQLLNLLLEYTLAKHEIRIKKFIELFHRIDNDNNGMIDEQEFMQLISALNLSINRPIITKLLATLDPYKNEKITLSDCLSVFESVFLSI